MSDECGGCVCEVNTCYKGPAYDTPEGRDMRLRGAVRLGHVCLAQIAASALCTAAGLVQIGFALPNPSYPLINGYAVITGILMLIGGIYGRRAASESLDGNTGPGIRKGVSIRSIMVHYVMLITFFQIMAHYVTLLRASITLMAKSAGAYMFLIMVHYVMSITCLTFASLQITFTSQAVGQCFSQGKDASNKCWPYITPNEVIGIIVVVLAVILEIASIFGTVFFCRYAHVFGFTNHYAEMQRQINTLRQQVNEQNANEPRDLYKNSYSSFDTKSPV